MRWLRFARNDLLLRAYLTKKLLGHGTSGFHFKQPGRVLSLFESHISEKIPPDPTVTADLKVPENVSFHQIRISRQGFPGGNPQICGPLQQGLSIWLEKRDNAGTR
jgi:hypothetical protein